MHRQHVPVVHLLLVDRGRLLATFIAFCHDYRYRLSVSADGQLQVRVCAGAGGWTNLMGTDAPIPSGLLR